MPLSPPCVDCGTEREMTRTGAYDAWKRETYRCLGCAVRAAHRDGGPARTRVATIRRRKEAETQAACESVGHRIGDEWGAIFEQECRLLFSVGSGLRWTKRKAGC